MKEANPTITDDLEQPLKNLKLGRMRDLYDEQLRVMGHKTTAMDERYAHATDGQKKKRWKSLKLRARSMRSEKDCHKFAIISEERSVAKVVND